MITTYARFRQLKGIGEAREAQLHEAGLRTWAALAQTLDALAQVRNVDSDLLRSLRDQARAKADENDQASGAVGERAARFVVSVATQPDGRVARTSVTDVRDELTKTFAGLEGGEVAAFIKQRLHQETQRPHQETQRPHREAPASETAAMPTRSPSTDRTEFDPGVPLHFAASAVDNEMVIIDAGKTLGGTMSQLGLRWDTSDIETGEMQRFRYRASLSGCPYGGGLVHWQTLSRLVGNAHPGEIVELPFDVTGLPHGIHRLELTIEVQPAVGTGRAHRRIQTRVG